MRTKRRLMALLMAMLLCLGLTPAVAWATPGEWPEGRTEINSVNLNIDAPEAGEKPSYDAQAGGSGAYEVDYVDDWFQVAAPGDLEYISWLDEDAVFENNSWYYVEMRLSAGYGHTFIEGANVVVTDAEKTSIMPSDSGESAWVYAWFRVGDKPQETSSITSINLGGVPIPTVGMTWQSASDGPGWNNVAPSDGIGICHLYNYGKWNASLIYWSSLWSSDASTVESGETYRVVLDLFAEDGYSFANQIATVAVNGEKAYVLEQSSGYARIMLMFKPGETAEETDYPEFVTMKYAEVSSEVWPVYGMTIPKSSDNFSVSDDCYTLEKAEWQIWESTGWRSLNETETQFKHGLNTIRIYAEVKAVPWARFADKYTVIGSINGDSGTSVNVLNDGEICTLDRKPRIYDALFAHSHDDEDQFTNIDYDGVPF